MNEEVLDKVFYDVMMHFYLDDRARDVKPIVAARHALSEARKAGDAIHGAAMELKGEIVKEKKMQAVDELKNLANEIGAALTKDLELDGTAKAKAD